MASSAHNWAVMAAYTMFGSLRGHADFRSSNADCSVTSPTSDIDLRTMSTTHAGLVVIPTGCPAGSTAWCVLSAKGPLCVLIVLGVWPSRMIPIVIVLSDVESGV